MKYILTIRTRFEAMDDAEARISVHGVYKKAIDEVDLQSATEIKLQRIYDNAPPQSIEL